MEFYELRRTIIDLLNLDTGLEESALQLLAQKEDSVVQLRKSIEVRLHDKNPLYACGTCGQPVAISCRRTPEKSHVYFFRHLYKSEDCPIKTGSGYTKDEIRRMKYNGAKESAAHIELKNYIADQLRMDTRFAQVQTEKVIRGSGWSRHWKKPDISALFNGSPVVFEIQLSTTFLDVIVSRERFYQSEGIPIFWIFSNLNPNTALVTEKDIFFNNKSNALSVTNESKDLSIKNGQLTFIGHFKQPYFNQNRNIIEENWVESPITIDNIQFDPETHKPFFASFDEQYEVAVSDLESHRIRKPIQFLEKLALDDDPTYWDREACAQQLTEVGLYTEDDLDPSFLKFIKALLSLRDQKIHFLNQTDKWVWLANYVWEHHMSHWLVYLFAVNEYGMSDIAFPSANHKLKAKRQEFKENWQRHKRYDQDNKYYPLIAALLPELKSHLQRFSSQPL